MNPFDMPPDTPPVSFDAPNDEPPRHRGRMALVALAAAGLVGGGLVGVSQLVSADRPEVAENASLAAIDTPADDDVDDGTEPDEPSDDPDGNGDGGDDGDDGEPVVGGQIVIDTGDGEPIVVDLEDLDDGALDRFHECVGLPSLGAGHIFDFELGDGEFPFDDMEEFLEGLPLEDFEDFAGPIVGGFGVFPGDGTHITVMGPDGLSVIELGEGDGSATITQEGGEVTITTDGDATVSDVTTALEDLSLGHLDGLGPSHDFEEFFESLPLDELAQSELFQVTDPAEIEACLATLDNG